MSYSIGVLAKAIEEAKAKAKKRRFKQSVELIVVLRDVDVRKPENRINMPVFLPNPPSKEAKVCVIASGDLELKAKNSRADLVVSRDELIKLADNKKAAKDLAKKYDFFLAQADLMPTIGRLLGRYLGPRGKMPQPVTSSMNINALVDRFKRSVRIRIKNQPVISCRIGTEDQDSKKLAENAMAILNAIESKFKKQNIDRIYVKLTMGPAVKVR
ncbi:MAG: 50S ribosomal protein L1 [Thermoprotei archaeon]|nr:MAG: 50S ribosomal protein L1 [Thermoprotei archaeon]